MDRTRHIFLTGFMGAGKTRVGGALSEKLGMDFSDLDSEVEKAAGRSVRDIFEARGEAVFRKMETRALEDVCRRSGATVVSTGGGCVLSPRNRELMNASGEVFYLEACVDALWERVRDKSSRPLLDAEDPYGKFRELFASRKEIYELAAHAVSTDESGVGEVADGIIEILKKNRRL